MTRSGLLLLFLAFGGTALAAPPIVVVEKPVIPHKLVMPKPDNTPLPFKPHYVSQRGNEAYMREGPTFSHKVLWVYRHKGYPFLVTASFDIWRRVQDADGTVGWMSAQMLSDNRTVLVTDYDRVRIHETVDPDSPVVGLADPNAILGLKGCVKDSCRVYANGIDGWIAKSAIWGVDKNELIR